jgi:tRNA nucleotidyltransferase (CCA-adding enzyme)
MAKKFNLKTKIAKQLPPELIELLNIAGKMANRQGQNLYLVGGVIRDLLLGRTNLDLDLVVEGDATKLARKIIETKPGKITTHSRFNTAKIQWQKWSVDLATARSETYAKPGALPIVKPSSIRSDLFRRDFTINTMAVYLNPSNYGELIDLYGGREDLGHKLVRVLHERSFIDDATRILRGIRYEQRLSFQLEPTTLQLLKRDVTMLDTISGDRIRHELELILKEELPERTLYRAEELGVLSQLGLVSNDKSKIQELFPKARRLTSPSPPPTPLYTALLIYHLGIDDIEKLISRLRMPKLLAQTLRDTARIKTRLKTLDDPKLNPSRIYHILHGYSPLAATANLLAIEPPVARQHIELYLNKLRYIKTALSGDDLIRMGIPPGPQIKETLNLLHEARLDGKVKSKLGEEEMVRGWLTYESQN